MRKVMRMPGQASNAKQVSSLGETPAEARRRMSSSGGAVPSGQADATARDGAPPSPRHIAAMREQEGFGGGPEEADGSVEEGTETAAPPSPEKAMNMIQQLSQEKLQFQTELTAALAKLGRYEAQFGTID